MIETVTILCDRCGESLRGVIIESGAVPKLTGGFYDVAVGSCWNEFARTQTETNVCDKCMWSDPVFLEKYPSKNKVP